MGKHPKMYRSICGLVGTVAWLLLASVVHAGPGSLGGLWHLDESWGNTARDSSGNGNDGTLVGANFTRRAKFGEHAARFDGVDDFVSIPSAPVLEPAQITVELWVKSIAPGDFSYLVSKGSQGCSAASYSINKSGTGGGLAFDVFDGTLPGFYRSPATPATVFDGSWHHVAGTFDGAYVRMYLDGVEVGPGTAVSLGFAIKYDLPTTTALLFGNYDCGTSLFYYKGLMDEVRIWNRALGPNEVLASAQAGLRALWHFNEFPGSQRTADDSGYKNTGTLKNGATFSSHSVDPISGTFGNALKLDGVSDFVEVSDVDKHLNPPNAITVEAWVRVNTYGFYPGVVSKGNVGNYLESYDLFIDPSGLPSFLVNTNGLPSGRGMIIAGPAIPLNTWVHIAGTYDGATVRLYRNGVLVGSLPWSGTINQLPDSVLIGKSDRSSPPGSPYPDSFFDGKIDEAHIWARALSGDEIKFIADPGTRAELIVPDEISQKLGSGAVYASNWDYDGPGSPQRAMALEFIVSNDDGSAVIKKPNPVPPPWFCVTDRGSAPGIPALGGLLGCETGIDTGVLGGKSALISGKQVLVKTGWKWGLSKTLHLHINLTDGTQLGADIQWQDTRRDDKDDKYGKDD